MNIHAKTIPHNQQRYETVGDYFRKTSTGTDEFCISDMANVDYEFLVLIHELIEQHLTVKRNILESDITRFDIAFEELRAELPELIGDMEPGDMTNAPYHKEHVFATGIEKIIAAELGVNWDDYDKTVNALSKEE